MAEVYSSLYKGNVHVTTPFSTSHKAIDLGNYKVKNPVYSPNKLGSGTVSYVATSYTDSTGKLWNDSLVVYIKYDNGMTSRHFHGYPADKVVTKGQRVSVGQQVYRTGNSGRSLGDHLHYALLNSSGVAIDPVPYVLNDEVLPTFKIGDRVIFTEVQNIRSGSGTTYQVLRDSVVGEKGTIKDGYRLANGYTWWDISFDSGSSGWVAEVGKFKVLTVEPPQPPQQTECEKEAERLNGIIKGCETTVKSLTDSNAQLTTDLGMANDRVKVLEGNLLLRDKELDTLQIDYDRVYGERKNLEIQYNEVVTELNALKEGRDNWLNRLADILHKLFSGTK